ncbi:MAG: arginyltransferase [Magnetococcales bacterium]|nr:arginyltransferase [Magnetococcales bacterium]
MSSRGGSLWNNPTLNLYLSRSHACGYLADRLAATLFVDPEVAMNDILYAFLMERGFRRSGGHVYCPYCPTCRACQAVRVPVVDYRLPRSMRRVWQRNQDLTVRMMLPAYTQERFELYRDYINGRHQGGPMANPSPDDFMDYLIAPWSTTRFVEFRQGERLLMVAVTDILPTALSAVYTFFRPDEAARSLGSYAILWQIHEALGLEKSHLYLGYWIAECQKMDYKARFQPLELYQGRQWVRFLRGPSAAPESSFGGEAEQDGSCAP